MRHDPGPLNQAESLTPWAVSGSHEAPELCFPTVVSDWPVFLLLSLLMHGSSREEVKDGETGGRTLRLIPSGACHLLGLLGDTSIAPGRQPPTQEASLRQGRDFSGGAHSSHFYMDFVPCGDLWSLRSSANNWRPFGSRQVIPSLLTHVEETRSSHDNMDGARAPVGESVYNF